MEPSRIPRRIAIALTVALVAVPQGARADGALRVDAGWSVVADAGVPVSLKAQLEGVTGTAQVQWAEPEGCSVDRPFELVTAATCWSPGVRTFSITATDDVATAVDTVSIAARREQAVEIAHATGEITMGLPDEYAAGGSMDGATTALGIDPPAGATALDVTLDWGSLANDLDLEVRMDGGASLPVSVPRMITKPERVVLTSPEPVRYTATVRPKRSGPEAWTLDAVATVREGYDLSIPSVVVPRTRAEPGEEVLLVSEIDGGVEPYEIAWESDPGSIAYDDGSGDAFSFTFEAPATVKVRVRDAQGFESFAQAFVRGPGPVTGRQRATTVVAVVDAGFSPYHYDFVGHQHPWNTDADPTNDIDLEANPASYLGPSYPDADPTPINITIPTSPGQAVGTLAETVDHAEWAKLQVSELAAVHAAWLPGTKVVAAVDFHGDFLGENSSHGTRSAASAVGNIHGTCPECLVVLISGGSEDGLRWAASQPWIDVVTNSYGTNSSGAARDGVYLDDTYAATRAATQTGQTIVFSGGNGMVNAYGPPQLTYTSAEKGPDWIVTVGAVAPGSQQTYAGDGKPVDVSSVGSAYPSTGGTTANGTGTHSGTSNAAPVVAGYYASTIQFTREVLGDTSPGVAGGIVASGEPVGCGEATEACPLGDGALTRTELDALVLRGAQPSAQAFDPGARTIPTEEHAYAYQGHGVYAGQLGDWRAQQRGIQEVATGLRLPAPRPTGERTWFEVDSYCRQRLWGGWDGGYWRGGTLEPDPVTDTLAAAWLSWCSQMPEAAFASPG